MKLWEGGSYLRPTKEIIMLPLLLALPTLHKVFTSVVLPSLNGGMEKKNVKELSQLLYSKVPSTLRFVDEKTFIDFCMKHQDKIFPQAQKAVAKTAPAKKKAVKKAVAKTAAKKKATLKKTR